MDKKHNHRHSVHSTNELSIQLMVSNEVYVALFQFIFEKCSSFDIRLSGICGLNVVMVSTKSMVGEFRLRSIKLLKLKKKSEC